MKYKIDLWITYRYYSYDLTYHKIIELDFIPFIGLTLEFHNDEVELDVELVNNDYAKTSIHYNVLENIFIVDVTNRVNLSFQEEIIISTVEEFKQFNFIKSESTNIEEFIRVMKYFYNKENN